MAHRNQAELAGVPQKKLEAFYATFRNRADAEPCIPCTEAVLDAARR